MNTSLKLTPLLLAAAWIALVATVRGQLNIPSDGSDGDFVTPVRAASAPFVIDLAEAVTGKWDANNAANAGKGIYDPEKWAVVFKYNSVNVRSNNFVYFKNHPSGAPVVWLVKGDVRIVGTVSVSGTFNTEAFRWEPGPGGFRPAYSDAKINTAGSGGFGPGGSFSRSEYGAYGVSRGGRGPYGNSQIVPLIGGSGAGFGNYNDRGPGHYWYNRAFAQDAGGGGAILIASSGELALEGAIFAYDRNDPFGPGSDAFYGGSGGAIRLIALALNGKGRIEATGWESGSLWGRIRVETPSYTGGIHFYPETAAVPPANPPLIWPAANAPTTRIISVAGKPAPADPRSSLEANPPADVQFGEESPVEILIETTNMDPSAVVKVRVTPKLSGDAFEVPAVFDSGNTARATWIATTKFARGYAALQVRAVGP